jgi:hypothetical protein
MIGSMGTAEGTTRPRGVFTFEWLSSHHPPSDFLVLHNRFAGGIVDVISYGPKDGPRLLPTAKYRVTRIDMRADPRRVMIVARVFVTHVEDA